MQQQSPRCLLKDPRSLRTLHRDRCTATTYSEAMDMTDLEVGTVALLLFQDRVVVLLLDVGTLGVVGLLGLEHTLLKETRCFLQVEQVPV